MKPLPPYDSGLLKALSNAVDIAKEHKQRLITSQHLLLSILEEGDSTILDQFRSARVTPSVVIKALRDGLKIGRAKYRQIKSKADLPMVTMVPVSKKTSSLISQTPKSSPDSIITLDGVVAHWLSNNATILRKLTQTNKTGRRASMNSRKPGPKSSSHPTRQ